MTHRRVAGVRGSFGLALALLLGPALALAAAPGGGLDPGATTAPAAAPQQGSFAAAEPRTTSGSTGGTVAGRVSVSALTVRLELSQVVVRAGRSVQVRAIVTNESAAGVADVRLTIRADPTGIAFRPAASRAIRRIAPGRAESVTWSACGQAAGTYSLVATADVAGVLVASRPQQLLITAGKAC